MNCLHRLNDIIDWRHYRSPDDAKITFNQAEGEAVIIIAEFPEAKLLPEAIKLGANAPGDFPIVEREAKAIFGLRGLVEDRPVVIAGQE